MSKGTFALRWQVLVLAVLRQIQEAFKYANVFFRRLVAGKLAHDVFSAVPSQFAKAFSQLIRPPAERMALTRVVLRFSGSITSPPRAFLQNRAALAHRRPAITGAASA